MIKFIINLLRGTFKSKKRDTELPQSPGANTLLTASTIPSMTGSTLLTGVQQEEVKEISYFSRANNLIAEFHDPPPKISASNFSAWEYDNAEVKPQYAPIEFEYKGYMILAIDDEDLQLKKKCIDDGYTSSFTKAKSFYTSFRPENKPADEEKEELLKDDVDLLKGTYKPDIPLSNTVIITGIPKTENNDETRL